MAGNVQFYLQSVYTYSSGQMFDPFDMTVCYGYEREYDNGAAVTYDSDIDSID